MGVRTNWFDALPTAADAAEASTESGPCANEQDPVKRLQAELAACVDEESRLFDCGVTCPIRDNPSSVCTACPATHHGDALSVMQPLCKVGRRMDRVLTELTIAETYRK